MRAVANVARVGAQHAAPLPAPLPARRKPAGMPACLPSMRGSGENVGAAALDCPGCSGMAYAPTANVPLARVRRSAVGAQHAAPLPTPLPAPLPAPQQGTRGDSTNDAAGRRAEAGRTVPLATHHETR